MNSSDPRNSLAADNSVRTKTFQYVKLSKSIKINNTVAIKL